MGPEGGGGLALGVELDTGLSVEGDVTEERALGARPVEHGEGNGDGNVDTNLSGLGLLLELAASGTRVGEDGGTVSVPVLVDDLDSLVHGLSRDDGKHGAKDLVGVSGHGGVNLYDGRADKVSVGVALNGDATAIKEDLASLLLDRADEAVDLLLGLGRDNRSEVGTLLEATVDLEVLGTLNELGDPLAGLADKDGNGESHAALASSTKGSTGNGVEGEVLVGIGHDDTVVLGTKVGLDALALDNGTVVNVLSGVVTTNERDGLDVGSVTDTVDSVGTTVDDVEDSRGHTGLGAELGNDHGSSLSLIHI